MADLKFTTRDPADAFNQALQDGRLFLSKPFNYQDARPCVGDYMYVYTDQDGRDQFKHIDTRKYLA